MQFRTVLINYFRLTYSRGSFTVVKIRSRNWRLLARFDTSDWYTNKGETITRVNGNVSFFAGKRLENV